MRFFRLRLAGLALCISLIPVCATPLFSQDQQQPQQRGYGGGGGRGMFMRGGGNGAMGKVTAVSGTDLTIRDDQGQVYKVETGPNTRIRRNREEAKLSDIHVGDTIMAAGNLDEQARSIGAMFVVVLDPQQAAEAEKRRAEFGKTWTAGKVTAIKDLTVTIERPDKVTQTIAVDENTTFHKGMRGNATDITFPEIKVGDMVTAQGALQGGNFLATSLSVMERRPGGPGRFGGRPEGQPEGAPTGSAPPQPPDSRQN